MDPLTFHDLRLTLLALAGLVALAAWFIVARPNPSAAMLGTGMYLVMVYVAGWNAYRSL